MKPIDTQITLGDINPEYQAFVDKFKPKKTTDDCYTPQNVYEAVKNWACEEYGIDPDTVVRPFWPGGDYERFPYKDTDTVIDNPPFSILTQIVNFYNAYEIPFFLFAPYLTNFNSAMSCSHIIAPANIVYENKAAINTSFLTNLDKWLVRSVPELKKAIDEENKKNVKPQKKELPKYVYPDEVLTATMVGYLCSHGIEYKLAKENAFFIRGLQSQKAENKSIFGGGFLLSEKAAMERAAMERAAMERAAMEKAAMEKASCIKWALSEKELFIVKNLGKTENE